MQYGDGVAICFMVQEADMDDTVGSEIGALSGEAPHNMEHNNPLGHILETMSGLQGLWQRLLKLLGAIETKFHIVAVEGEHGMTLYPGDMHLVCTYAGIP